MGKKDTPKLSNASHTEENMEMAETPETGGKKSELTSSTNKRKKLMILSLTVFGLGLLLAGSICVYNNSTKESPSAPSTNKREAVTSHVIKNKKLNFEQFDYGKAIKVKPVKVIDGNHIEVSNNGETGIVRLLLTNAPELNSATGKEAKAKLENEISGLKNIYIKFDQDYGKTLNRETVAYVMTDSINSYLEYVLLGNGLAEVKNIGDKDNNEQYKNFLSMQEASKSEKLGMWSE
ncbi:thermonuclease family protein [Enterococcus raffinosus]|uniref:thermonuclease family protein n=1 Tax=Enterococcus raffinosus TaxID=71452 RepID=UPI00288EC205|nr:thermonuclease family protein [Enterococcus raffinosus]MDT2525135.1 thermonuclease family protein [Enterococcus raffinosus]MDT2592490.1 thermonuclease family protein [Enterococcus raffinosus]